jgi:integrase/recombinase XerD
MKICVNDAIRTFVSKNEEIMLSRALNDFMKHLQAAGRSKSTIVSYHRDLDRLMKILGDKEMDSIKDSHVNDAVIRLCSCNRGKSKRSAVSMNRLKSVYRSFFRWSFETERISRNPARFLFMTRTSSQPTMPITIEEIKLLLRTIHESDDPLALRDEALFAVYAFTGIRRAEALALRIKDYDPVAMTICLVQTKGGVKRMQPVSSYLACILNKLICRMKDNDRCSPLFPGRKHWLLPLSLRQVQNRFDKWKTLAGIRNDLTIHSFRAGFANLLYESTGDIHLVATAMGHSDIRSTSYYVKNNIYSVRKAIEKVFAI